MCSSLGPTEIDTHAVDPVIRVLLRLATVNTLNQELLQAIIEGDSNEELAENFTSGDLGILQRRIGNLLFRQLEFDPSLPKSEMIEILKKAFELARVPAH